MPSLNKAVACLAEGGAAIGIGITHLRSVAAVQLAQASGYDWFFVDMEHGACSLDAAAQMFTAGLLAGLTPFARVGRGALQDAARALDTGAQGVILPQIESREEAEAAVAALRYPPVGRRGWGGTSPHFGFRPPAVGDAMAIQNGQIAIVAIIETPSGVEQVDAIAATEGIDILLIGATDLSIQMGIPGQYSAPAMQDVFARAAAACRQHGKHLGMGGIYDQQWAARYHDLGARFLAGGSDHAFMLSAARSRADFLRGLSRDL
ncbi:aldolase [Rhizorhabdus wittichii]|uniref:Aldolase n=1 Tax=Rhizorhabdus wittichii TaxID=160791 RepID=A0A975HCD2_9SPHN|nr:aldolase/citrate lyase family protein [Rhizorhabdus wittichii]QTH20128.1 aldolase [Rhizorhabdus wittichii]